MPLNCQHGISIFDYFRPETKPTASRALHLSSFAEKAFKLAHASFLSFWCKHLQMWPLCIFDLNFDNHRHINMYLCMYVCKYLQERIRKLYLNFHTANFFWIKFKKKWGLLRSKIFNIPYHYLYVRLEFVENNKKQNIKIYYYIFKICWDPL